MIDLSGEYIETRRTVSSHGDAVRALSLRHNRSPERRTVRIGYPTRITHEPYPVRVAPQHRMIVWVISGIPDLRLVEGDAEFHFMSTWGNQLYVAAGCNAAVYVPGDIKLTVETYGHARIVTNQANRVFVRHTGTDGSAEWEYKS